MLNAAISIALIAVLVGIRFALRSPNRKLNQTAGNDLRYAAKVMLLTGIVIVAVGLTALIVAIMSTDSLLQTSGLFITLLMAPAGIYLIFQAVQRLRGR